MMNPDSNPGPLTTSPSCIHLGEATTQFCRVSLQSPSEYPGHRRPPSALPAPINFWRFPFQLSCSSGLVLTAPGPTLSGLTPAGKVPFPPTFGPQETPEPGPSQGQAPGACRGSCQTYCHRSSRGSRLSLTLDLLLAHSSSRNKSSGQVSPRIVLLEDQDRPSGAGVPYTVVPVGSSLREPLKSALSRALECLPGCPALPAQLLRL